MNMGKTTKLLRAARRGDGGAQVVEEDIRAVRVGLGEELDGAEPVVEEEGGVALAQDGLGVGLLVHGEDAAAAVPEARAPD